ncbi:MAG TPA: right-handed parallel beta-helix repeat-containing protein [Caulobacteraceae bacterium]
MRSVAARLLEVAVAVAVAFPALASAQNTQSFVASTGDDTAACTRGAPCRNIQAALGKTVAGGEVDCLDAADYGVMTITQAITIQCTTLGSVTAPSGITAVTIQAGANDAIHLSGLAIEAQGAGQYGIRINSAGSVTIEHCVISGFNLGYSGGFGNGYGIFDQNSTPTKLLVTDTVLAKNGTGVFILPSSASRISLIHVLIMANAYYGVQASSEATSAPVHLTISDSVISQNVNDGIEVQSEDGTGPISAVIAGTTITDNTMGLLVSGSNASASISSSVVTNNLAFGLEGAGSTLVSYANNMIADNGAGSGVFTTAPLQ